MQEIDPRNNGAGAARLCQAFFTGLVLTLVSQRGTPAAAEFVYSFFRRKQREQFLPGLEKLGLQDLPDAVACASYHYLSNHLGGVLVEMVRESETKAWVRYPPPRWAWTGSAICGIPTEVSRAMLRGWHARNGISLNNPRLGFVCTKQTVDGMPGLEGYYLDHGVDLEPEDRLKFSPAEGAPPFDPELAPVVPASAWPAERLAKARRNYGLDYVKTALIVLAELRGESEAEFLGGRTARLIGLQLVEEMKVACGTSEDGPRGVAAIIGGLSVGLGDATSGRLAPDGSVIIETPTWRMMRGESGWSPSAAKAWSEVWIGLGLGVDRFVDMSVDAPAGPEDGWRWKIRDPKGAR